ncbi:MAG: AAA family ATPase [Deltaproteobacteria bacterium]|nr:AAA family ATPase [Deltaproteobacteria bacterium]
MKRTIYPKLLAWKSNHRRKPLLIQGARQVGKTYLVEAFGTREYGNFVNFNFEQNLRSGRAV